MHINIFRIACIIGGLGVAIGAFGAHALKDVLEAQGTVETFKTAVLYHFVHGLFLLGLSFSPYHQSRTVRRLSWAISGGILFFSGSLYLLSTLGWDWLGPVTPLGGLLFIGSWIYAAVSAQQSIP